jgi:Xaa-Pro aminopeptidase
MKSDLDRLMAELNLDAIIVMGDNSPNTYRDYLTNRSRAGGSVFKKRGEPPIYVVRTGMELGEAAVSGLEVHRLFDFGQHELTVKHSGSPDLVTRDLFCNILRQLEITGRVGFYGMADVAQTMIQLSGVRECIPDLEVVLGGAASSLFSRAYATKDDQEIAALYDAGQRTSQVVAETWDFISGHSASGEFVVQQDGSPLTIGRVKQFIQQRELELNLDESSGCIFAQGHDAGVPHSHGNNAEPLRLGTTIVFDITPRDATNGYYHDMTRTWCIGYVPDQVQAAFEDEWHVFQTIKSSYRLGEITSSYQVLVCELFEAKGHLTPRSHPGTLEGYVHGLGHGLGLNIHESPSFQLDSQNVLEAGNVFTVEPGLYYPERGFGIRLEDTVHLDSNGTLHTLTNFHYDLVLPLKR